MYNNDIIEEKSWFKRNWKWVVPAGGCLTLIVIAIIFIVSAIYGISNSFDNSNHAQYVMEQINKNEKAIEVLGEPIKKGKLSDFNYQWVNGETKVSFNIEVSGVKNKGIVYVSANKEGDSDNYYYREVTLEIDETDNSIDLLSEND